MKKIDDTKESFCMYKSAKFTLVKSMIDILN
jgi:hypothetical protein